MNRCYLDTSALAKWYIAEPGSDAFEAFLQDLPEAVVSRLTATELRCLLARRRRAGDFDADFERDAYAQFERDLGAGHLTLHPFTDALLDEATALIERLAHVPLRTLDALHLVIMMDAEIDGLATADNVMSHAAEELGVEVTKFGV